MGVLNITHLLFFLACCVVIGSRFLFGRLPEWAYFDYEKEQR